MISNNLKALLIHAAINVITFVLYFAFNVVPGVAEFATPEAYQKHVDFSRAVSVAIIAFAIILYYFGGKFLLKNHGNLTRNLLSVCGVAVIGIVWWCVIFPISELDAFSNSNIWFTFSIYVSYMLSLLEHVKNEITLLLFMSTIVPSIFMAVGIKLEA